MMIINFGFGLSPGNQLESKTGTSDLGFKASAVRSRRLSTLVAPFVNEIIKNLASPDIQGFRSRSRCKFTLRQILRAFSINHFFQKYSLFSIANAISLTLSNNTYHHMEH